MKKGGNIRAFPLQIRECPFAFGYKILSNSNIDGTGSLYLPQDGLDLTLE
jgi:hypothetical protein